MRKTKGKETKGKENPLCALTFWLWHPHTVLGESEQHKEECLYEKTKNQHEVCLPRNNFTTHKLHPGSLVDNIFQKWQEILFCNYNYCRNTNYKIIKLFNTDYMGCGARASQQTTLADSVPSWSGQFLYNTVFPAGKYRNDSWSFWQHYTKLRYITYFTENK